MIKICVLEKKILFLIIKLVVENKIVVKDFVNMLLNKNFKNNV